MQYNEWLHVEIIRSEWALQVGIKYPASAVYTDSKSVVNWTTLILKKIIDAVELWSMTQNRPLETIMTLISKLHEEFK